MVGRGRSGPRREFPADERLNERARGSKAARFHFPLILSARIRQRLGTAVLEILIEAPALDLREDFVEFAARQGLIHEALTTAEFAEIPCVVVFELGRDRKFPERQVFR